MSTSSQDVHINRKTCTKDNYIWDNLWATDLRAQLQLNNRVSETDPFHPRHPLQSVWIFIHINISLSFGERTQAASFDAHPFAAGEIFWPLSASFDKQQNVIWHTAVAISVMYCKKKPTNKIFPQLLSMWYCLHSTIFISQISSTLCLTHLLKSTLDNKHRQGKAVWTIFWVHHYLNPSKMCRKQKDVQNLVTSDGTPCLPL